MSLTANIFATAIDALSKKPDGSGSLITVIRSLVRYPVKTVAAFLCAPILAFRVARVAKNPIRRLIASTGLFISFILAWFAGTFIGTATGAALISTKFGVLVGLGFFIGTSFSITLSVAFSIVVLNASSWFFLQMSSEEVVAYLKSISD